MGWTNRIALLREYALINLNNLLDPASGWTIGTSPDINDVGQIAGQGTVSGQADGYLLSPPEPWQAVALSVARFPSTAMSGAAGSFTVTALDAYGNIATGYTGTVHFTSSDTQAALPGDYPFTAGDGGVQTFNATLNTVGLQSITVSDAAAGLAATQSGITVKPARLAVSGFPSPITAGSSGSFTVTALDALGNIATAYTGTVHLSSSDPQAWLPNYTFTAADLGVHTFSASLYTAGLQSITAADIAMASVTGAEGSILVTPAAASRFVLSGPATVTLGTAFSITVTAYDAYGNLATGYTGTVAFKSSTGSGTATLPAKYKFTSGPGGDNGVHTFTGLVLKKKGTQTITVYDTLTSSILGTWTVTVV